MTVIKGYEQFGGIHWETAALRQVLTHQGVMAPHTGKPFTEAMLLGISGGIGAMYFVFEYENVEPSFYFSARNVRIKVDPMVDTCQRLGVKAKVQVTASPEKAVANLTKALDAGLPTIVWTDKLSMPYSGLARHPHGGWMLPLVVYGYDEEDRRVYISDRAGVPLSCTPAELALARAGLASTKHRMMILAKPGELNDLPGAIVEGIRACLTGYLEPPMKNFGLPALQKWADLMTDPKDKKAWPQLFATGSRLYNNLRAAFTYIDLEGTGGGGARPLYADFLEEASPVVGKPELRAVAAQFRACAAQWGDLAEALLPGPVLGETRDVLRRREQLFRVEGAGALPELVAMTERLRVLKASASESFPLGQAETAALREEIRERLLGLHAAEQEAVLALQQVVPS